MSDLILFARIEDTAFQFTRQIHGNIQILPKMMDSTLPFLNAILILSSCKYTFTYIIIKLQIYRNIMMQSFQSLLYVNLSSLYE